MEYVMAQFSSLLTLFLTGMILGGFFDFYRVWRSMVKVNWLITAGGDLIFWLLALLIAIPLIFWSTWLELRLYVWIAIAGGAICYFIVFSRLLIPVLLRFRRLITWTPRQVNRMKQQMRLLWQKSGRPRRAAR